MPNETTPGKLCLDCNLVQPIAGSTFCEYCYSRGCYRPAEEIARDLDTTAPLTWRKANTITDWEFARIGMLLCNNSPRDLALMIVRLEEQVELLQQLRHSYPGQ